MHTHAAQRYACLRFGTLDAAMAVTVCDSNPLCGEFMVANVYRRRPLGMPAERLHIYLFEYVCLQLQSTVWNRCVAYVYIIVKI